MYDSLLLPWTPPSSTTTPPPSGAELAYRASSPQLVRTKGTIFLPPPPDDALRRAFHAPPRPRSRMSAGAVALTKHFERNPHPERHPRVIAEGEGEAVEEAKEEAPAKRGGGDGYKAGKRREGEVHPFWAVPRGSNEEKTRVAGEVLEEMLRNAKWRNVMLLHEGVAVYEVRVGRGWGMRWTLGLERAGEGCDEGGSLPAGGREENGAAKAEEDMEGWRIASVTFRGFLEPIAGLDHELDKDDAAGGGEEEKGRPQNALTGAIEDPATR